MNPFKTIRASLVAGVLCAAAAAGPFANALPAQGVALVPPGDLAYRDVDRLVELGLLDTVIVGQRPYSRAEFARIVSVARDQLDRGASAWSASSDGERAGSAALSQLEQRFGDLVGSRGERFPYLSLIDGAALVFSSTNAERRPFPAPHTRSIEALVDPLAEPRFAQPAVRGNVTALELSQHLAPARWVSLYARERIEYRAPLDTPAGRLRGELLVGVLRVRYRNLGLSVGREALGWAQADGDGLFFASDAPAIDQVSLQSESPFVMGGPLRVLGPTKATLVVADLGPSSARSASKLLAYKVSILPAPWAEVGGTFMNHYGGEGGRSASFGNRLVDFLPFIDIFRRHNYTDTTKTLDVDSDKMLGIDGRVRIDRLAGMTVAGELLIDDFDVHSIQRMLTGYGSQTVRIIFPMVGAPSVSVRVGAKHMGTITYSHFALSSGFASRGRLLGEELGPDAKEFNAEVRWSPGGVGMLSLRAQEQVYSNATYAMSYTDADRVQTEYVKVSSTPDERRHILTGTMVLRPDADISLTFRAGGQVVENYDFAGYQRTDYVASVALRLRQ